MILTILIYICNIIVMIMKEKKVTFCPNCGKPVEAMDYSSLQGTVIGIGGYITGGMPDPVGARIVCDRCNYGGPPLIAAIEDYKKMDFSKWKMLEPPIARASPMYKLIARVFVFVLMLLIGGAVAMLISPWLLFVVLILAGAWFWKSG